MNQPEPSVVVKGKCTCVNDDDDDDDDDDNNNNNNREFIERFRRLRDY